MRLHWNNIFILLLSTITVGICSCSSDLFWDSLLLSDTPIQLEAGYDYSQTRGATDKQNRAFDPNETLNVYIKTNEPTAKIVGSSPIVCKTSEAVNNVNALTPDHQTYYPVSTNIDIYAVYPAIDASGSTVSFEVNATQNENTYKDNDLMYASIINQPRTDQPVRLQFSHKMTKFVVNVTLEEELTLEGINLINFNRTAVLDTSTGDLGSLSNIGPIAVENTGAALVPPQPIDNKQFLEVVTNLGTAYFSTTKTFEPGKEYQVSVTVGRVNLGLTANITDWTQEDARQIVEQTTADGYTIEYTKSLTFTEDLRTNPYIQPDMTITNTKVTPNTSLVRYTNATTDYDYEVVFFGNDQAGTATMVITGNPNKTDTQLLSWVKTFTIKQATGILSYPAYSAATTYNTTYVDGTTKLKVPYMNGAVVNWPCTMTCDPDAATFSSTNTNVATVHPTDGTVTLHGVGETTIMVSSPNNGNYTAANTSYNLEVTKRAASALNIVLKENNEVVTDQTYTYNGMPCTPSVTVYDGDATPENLLRPGIDYTVGFSNNLNAGTATVTVTGAGDYTGEGTKTFTINKITTVFNETFGDVAIPKNKSLERAASINHQFGTITYTSSNPNIATVSTTGTITAGNNTGNTTITVSVPEPNDPKNYTSKSMSYVVTVENYDQDYSYSGNVQRFVCKKTGTYLLEVWGGAGGTSNENFQGGGGAYVAGTVHLEKEQILYVYVGGAGSATGTGGWNGGGSGSATSSGGGGATDISICGTYNSTTWNETAHLNSRIIVAAGGGGGLNYKATSFLTSGYATGGGGGAYDGRSGSGPSPGKGGTLSRAGNSGNGNTIAAGFGYGGSYNGSTTVGCGGGGWYGGGSGGDASRHGSGGGGSSYMWTSANASYYNGHGTNNAPTTTGSKVTTSTSFYMIERAKSAGINDGNGKAKITYLSDD